MLSASPIFEGRRSHLSCANELGCDEFDDLSFRFGKLLPLVVLVVRAEDFRVGVHDELSAVTMPLPQCNYLHVHSRFPQPSDEKRPQTPLRKIRVAQSLLRAIQRMPHILDRENSSACSDWVGVDG